MLYGQEVFYFATVRKITSAFGALFTNIVISRYTNPGGQGTVIQTIRVPFGYGPSNKWLRILNESTRRGDELRLKTFFPRMSFELKGFRYDATRKLASLGSVSTVIPATSNAVTQYLKQLNPVPYDFDFDVNIATKSLDDGLQMLEQILPNFNPSFNLKIKDIPELGIARDVPVIFTNIECIDDYEGTFDEERLIRWTLSFTVKGYLYPNISNAGIIKEVIATIYGNEDFDQASQDAIVTVAVDPIDADPGDTWTPKTTIQDAG